MEMEMASEMQETAKTPALRRVAVQIAALLPNDLAAALTVLEMCREQVIEFLGEPAISS
jgi:hypothetical protein